MKILGKSRGVATVIAVALGLAVVTDGSLAEAQMSPTGLPAPTPPPAAKPAAPSAAAPAGQAGQAGQAGHAGQATPAAPKPTAPAAGTAAAAKPAAPAKPADAKALAASGEKKFKAGDYAGALADFEASETAKAAPETERFIGLAQDNLGHYPEAVVAYEKFLATPPASMKTQAEEAKKRVDAIKTMPGKVHVETTPAGAQITVDAAANPNAQANPAPTPTDLDLPAGHHTIKITAEGYTATDKEIDVTYASKQDVRVDLVKSEAPPPPPPPVVAEAPSPAPAPPPPPPPEPRSKVPAYVTGAVAIIATGVGIGFGVKALGQSSDFDKNPTTKKADDGENNALVADMMFGIAITFGVTSAVLFLSSDAPQSAKADPAKSTPRVAKAVKAPAKITITPAPYVTPTGGGASALVRF
jgi:hypothetical protein